jgi:hypothetical protein
VKKINKSKCEYISKSNKQNQINKCIYLKSSPFQVVDNQITWYKPSTTKYSLVNNGGTQKNNEGWAHPTWKFFISIPNVNHHKVSNELRNCPAQARVAALVLLPMICSMGYKYLF